MKNTLPFSNYIAESRLIIEKNRIDLANLPPDQAEHIIDANTPYEFHPEQPLVSNGKIKYGALLIHGLFDSPFSLKEIGKQLQSNGILASSVLLPGHGTKPDDLLNITYQDWIDVVRYGIASLKPRVEHLILIGFSTGSALAIHQALQDQPISAMVLLSPAIKLHPLVDLVMRWHRVRQWLRKNAKWAIISKENNYVKYQSIAFNPVSQVSALTELVASIHEEKRLPCPVFMCLTEQDETISSSAAIRFFSSLPQKENQLLLYTSDKKPKNYDDNRIIRRTACYPDLHVNHFSHTCIPFSRRNHHYGLNGDYLNNEKNTVYGAYNRLNVQTQNLLYYLGLAHQKKCELTFNPDFDFMSEQLIQFILGVT